MGNVFQKCLLLIVFVFFVTSALAMQADQPACGICLERATVTKLLVYPYACVVSKDNPLGHGLCEECWQISVFEHKYGGQLPLQCPQCRAAAKREYVLLYVDGVLPDRPVCTIDEEVVFTKDTVLDGNVLGYDICFGIHGSIAIRANKTLFFKNIRLLNVYRGCISSLDRNGHGTLLLQNVEIEREDDYFFPDALVYPGFVRISGAPNFWFKNPREFTDRHLRTMVRGLSSVDSDDEWQATPVAGPVKK